MRVKPQEGMIVRDPVTGVKLPSGGRNVPNTSFWRRRLAAGDVVDAPVPEVKVEKAPAETDTPAPKASRKPTNK